MKGVSTAPFDSKISNAVHCLNCSIWKQLYQHTMQLLIKPECCSCMRKDCVFHTSRLNASSCNKHVLVAYHLESFLSLSLLSLSCMSRRDACREACRAGSSGFTPGKVPRMEFSAAESSRICAHNFQTSTIHKFHNQTLGNMVKQW